MALPRDFDLGALLKAGQNHWEKTPAGLAAEVLRVPIEPVDGSVRSERRSGNAVARATNRHVGPEGPPSPAVDTSASPTADTSVRPPDPVAAPEATAAAGADIRLAEPFVTGSNRKQPADRSFGPIGNPEHPLAEAEARFLDPADSRLRTAERILELAEDYDLPLLDRLRHLAAAAANLDAAFAGGDDGMVLARSVAARALVIRHAYCFHHAVVPALAKADVELVRWDDLRRSEKEAVRTLFRELVYPVLTPLASVRTPPYVPQHALHLAVLVKDPSSAAQTLARVKVPSVLPRFVRTGAADSSAKGTRLVPLEDVIAVYLAKLFPGMQVLEHHPFRVTRARSGRPARLEVEESITPEVLDLLVGELGIGDGDIHRVPGPLDLTGLSAVADIDRPDLEHPPFAPTTHPDLARAEGRGSSEIFAVLRQRDVLVHHPYDSFVTSVQALLDCAAADPDVLAIKVVLGGSDARVEEPLAVAAAAGKQVIVVVDRGSRDDLLRASVDGRWTPAWVGALAAAGCQIAYGTAESRVHGRAALIVRAEADGKVRRYSHIGTGDYRPGYYEAACGGQQREDIGLLTADREVGEDLSDLFNHLTGYSRPAGYRRILVGPRSIRPGLVNRIEREIGHHRAGRPARIRIKCNAITDEIIAEALYRASRVGVPVEVWVRGTCVLRPQLPGMSETIRVRSVLGRFVEHSRIFAFDNGGEHEVWIGTADLVPAHLDRRLEAYVRLAATEHRRQLVELVETAMDDETSGWDLAADGSWVRRITAAGGPDAGRTRDLHEHLVAARSR